MARRQFTSGQARTLLALFPGLAGLVLWLAAAPRVSMMLGVGAAAIGSAAVLNIHERRKQDASIARATATAELAREVHSKALRSISAPPESERPVVSGHDGAAAPGRIDAEIGTPVLKAALDAADDLVLVFDSLGVVRYANRTAHEFFGGASRPLRDRAIEDLFVQSEILEMQRSALEGESRREEVQIAGRLGRRTFQSISVPIDRDAGSPRFVLLLLRDVTDVQSALRLGGDFVASVSHELRTPLASIKGALETLRDSASDDPSMTARLHQMIATNVDRLEALTADVLRLSQLESSGAAPEICLVETKPVLDSIASLLEPLLSERGLRIEGDIAPELRTIRTDPRLFELVLKNLLENAGKFAFENSVLRVVARAQDSGTIWHVIDRGIGIPLNQQSRIFDRFYQVDAARTGSPRRRGTGLGLAIVQNAVKALGGTIRVDSVWQQGTTMSVELPASIADELKTAELPT